MGSDVGWFHRTNNGEIPDPKYNPDIRGEVFDVGETIKVTGDLFALEQKNIPDNAIIKLEVEVSHLSRSRVLDEIEYILINECIDVFKSQERAAKALGITSRTIRSKLATYGKMKHSTSS